MLAGVTGMYIAWYTYNRVYREACIPRRHTPRGGVPGGDISLLGSGRLFVGTFSLF